MTVEIPADFVDICPSLASLPILHNIEGFYFPDI